MLGLRRQFADRHVFDHALPQRTYGLIGHEGCSCLDGGCEPLISRQDALSRYPVGCPACCSALPRERFSPLALSGCRTSALLGLLLWGYCCKSLFGGTNAISADASYERRREGPYRFIQNRPGTSIGALKSDTAAEKPKDQLSRDFSGRSIFDFCNNIVGKADMGKVCRLTDHFQLACLNLIMA